jgi:hypothetical protein
VQTPLTLDDLTVVVSRLLHVHDEPASPLQDETASGSGQLAIRAPGPERLAETRDTLRQLWRAILQLPPRYRVVYLLNPTDGELDIFPWHGVASLRDIGLALALTTAQYEQLWEALQLDEATRQYAYSQQSVDIRFAILWNFLPLEDLLIASLLGATRQQIINLRRLARDRLARQLRAAR